MFHECSRLPNLTETKTILIKNVLHMRHRLSHSRQKLLHKLSCLQIIYILPTITVTAFIDQTYTKPPTEFMSNTCETDRNIRLIAGVSDHTQAEYSTVLLVDNCVHCCLPSHCVPNISTSQTVINILQNMRWLLHRNT